MVRNPETPNLQPRITMIIVTAGVVATLLAIVIVLFVIGDLIDITHHPEYKNIVTYTLVILWGFLAGCCVATATYFSMAVAVKHFWLVGIAEMLLAFIIASWLSYKLYKATSLKINGVDYDVVLGKKRPS